MVLSIKIWFPSNLNDSLVFHHNVSCPNCSAKAINSLPISGKPNMLKCTVCLHKYSIGNQGVILDPLQPSRRDKISSPLPSSFGSTYAYYFATVENAAGILRWGHLSHNYASKLPTSSLRTLSNPEVMNLRKKWWNHCCLYFGTHTPTQYTQEKYSGIRQEELVFIRYKADEIFSIKDAEFSNGNLAKGGETKVYNAKKQSQHLKELAWKIILNCRDTYSESYKRVKQAELMVPKYISPNMIHSILVYDKSIESKLRNEFFQIKDLNKEQYQSILTEISAHGIEIPKEHRSSLPHIQIDKRPFTFS